MTTGAGMSGSAATDGKLVPKNHKGAPPGYDVESHGVNKGELGGEAEH